MAPPKLPPDLPPEALAAFQAMVSGGGQVADPSDPFVWRFNPGKPTAPQDRGMFEPMRTRVNTYEEIPSSKMELEFYTMDRDELKRFQELAYQAGLYGSSAEREDVPFGARDPDTFKIWQQMVGQAARYHRAGKMNTVWDALQELVDNRPENLGKKEKAKRAPLVTRITDPRELEELIFSTAPNVIGRNADPEFVKDFIAMYQAMEAQYQEQVYALQGTESGGQVTAPPSPEALASFRLRHERPEQFEEKRSAARHNQYLSLLKGAL